MPQGDLRRYFKVVTIQGYRRRREKEGVQQRRGQAPQEDGRLGCYIDHFSRLKGWVTRM